MNMERTRTVWKLTSDQMLLVNCNECGKIYRTKHYLKTHKWLDDMSHLQFLDSFDKMGLCPALFSKLVGIDWVFRFFWQNGLCPALFSKLGGIDWVFRFFWQNGLVPYFFFETYWNRLSCKILLTKLAFALPYFQNGWNRLSFSILLTKLALALPHFQNRME